MLRITPSRWQCTTPPERGMIAWRRRLVAEAPEIPPAGRRSSRAAPRFKDAEAASAGDMGPAGAGDRIARESQNDNANPAQAQRFFWARMADSDVLHDCW